MTQALSQLMVAKLLSRGTPLVNDKPWSALAGNLCYDGGIIRHTGPRRATDRVIATLSSAEEAGRVLVWVPNVRTQHGRITRSLDCGHTVAADDGRLVAFQSVVFVKREVVSIVARVPEGEFIQVSAPFVSAWDGTAINAPLPAAS